jgi:hypothetical protein
VILAIDLGLRTGLACFAVDDDDGARLLWFRSSHFATITVLKRGIPRVLDEVPALSLLVVEGDRHLGELWGRLAHKRGARVLHVAAEHWRPTMLLPRDRRDGPTAKAAAGRLARALIESSGAPRPKTELLDDVAEAICLGAWAARAAR